MSRIAASLAVCACLLGGCKTTLLPDPLEAHRLSRDQTVKVWVRGPGGQLREQRVEYRKGSVIALPEAMVGP
jgi:hypothetical protein